MAKNLKLIFKDDADKTHSIIITKPAEDLQADTVKASMQKIIDSQAFIDKNGQLYTKIDHAQYEELKITPIL